MIYFVAFYFFMAGFVFAAARNTGDWGIVMSLAHAVVWPLTLTVGVVLMWAQRRDKSW